MNQYTSACRWCFCLIPALVLWTSESGAEPIKPLITPLVVPLQEKPPEATTPIPELGFPGVPADGTSTLPLDEGFTPLPWAADPFADAPLSSDGWMDPLGAADATLGAVPPAFNEPTELPDSPDTSFSSVGDFSNNLGSLPQWQGGFLPSPGFGSTGSRGFAELPGNMQYGGGVFDDLRDGLGFSATLSGTYATNPSLGYGSAENSGQGDFFMTLGGAVNYLSRASTWTYGVRYSGSYSEYFSQSELSGYNQNAGGSLNYDGGPLTASLNVGIGFGSGANRNYESFVDELSFNYGVNARYRVSGKTSITGDFSQSFSSASGGSNEDIGSFNAGASALWAYSARTEFGPGISYTSSGGDSSQSRTSIGPTITLNYLLSKKISLNSRVGMDFAQYEDGENPDPSLSTSIALNYRASLLWGMNLSLNRYTLASYTNPGEFDETLALRVGYNRQIRRASWNLGMGWQTRTTEDSGGTTGSSADRDSVNFDTSLSMPVFADTCSASIFMSYSDQSGDGNQGSDSFQIGFSISRSF